MPEMRNVGIRELKNKLSRYLRLVKEGKEVQITDRGRIIARIIPYSEQLPSDAARLYEMASEGIVRLPERPLSDEPFEPVQIHGRPLSETILEDRR